MTVHTANPIAKARCPSRPTNAKTAVAMNSSNEVPERIDHHIGPAYFSAMQAIDRKLMKTSRPASENRTADSRSELTTISPFCAFAIPPASASPSHTTANNSICPQSSAAPTKKFSPGPNNRVLSRIYTIDHFCSKLWKSSDSLMANLQPQSLVDRPVIKPPAQAASGAYISTCAQPHQCSQPAANTTLIASFSQPRNLSTPNTTANTL